AAIEITTQHVRPQTNLVRGGNEIDRLAILVIRLAVDQELDRLTHFARDRPRAIDGFAGSGGHNRVRCGHFPKSWIAFARSEYDTSPFFSATHGRCLAFIGPLRVIRCAGQVTTLNEPLLW